LIIPNSNLQARDAPVKQLLKKAAEDGILGALGGAPWNKELCGATIGSKFFFFEFVPPLSDHAVRNNFVAQARVDFLLSVISI
jgi:hypothetical protein